MRMSKLFNQTLRDMPADTQAASHELLIRAGYIRPLATGIYSLLPLGLRSVQKIEQIIRHEMDQIGGQEVLLPLVQPAELWRESGRYYKIDAELSRFRDRHERELVLAMTHEEAAADLARKLVNSYKQLPALVYQIQTKWRDDPRPRAGLIRVREFIMKDSYSLDADWKGLEKQYRAHYQAYFNIFHRCGLDVIAVESDTGIMGGKLAHEFIVLTDVGEDTLILCPGCGYAANRQVATFKKIAKNYNQKPQPLSKVATPDCRSIEALATFLQIEKEQTAKAVFLMAEIANLDIRDEKLVFALVRGDSEVNETKLAKLINARTLRPATDNEIASSGAVPGYASPIGIHDALVVVDDLIPRSPNLVSGANETGYHYLNINYGRDYTADIVADISTARAGDGCPQCGSALTANKGIEVGNIFQLGTHFSETMGVRYHDEAGHLQPLVMGSYGIGIGRLLATIAEIHHDKAGLRLPVTISPFQVHLIVLSGKADDQPKILAENLYQSLKDRNIDTLYDDRNESPGIKFNDADLIGAPIRLTVSTRSIMQGGVEVKQRHLEGRVNIFQDSIVDTLQSMLADLYASINKSVKPMAYRE
jgi:prolyl-tRNA synthetase